MRRALPLLGLLLGLLLPGCAKDASHYSESATYQGAGPIRALCTTGMVADIVRNIGGDAVAVDQLMGAGVDPHLYKASTGDVERLSSADVIFYSGLHLEGKLAELFDRMAHSKRVVAVADGIPADRLLPVAQFDAAIHQRHDGEWFWKSKDYCNNFIFRKPLSRQLQ